MKRPFLLYLFLSFFCFFSCEKNDLFDHDNSLSLEDNLQKLADAYTSKGIPGMVLLIDHPMEGFHLIESGFSNLEDGLPLTKDHLFHSASLMKTYTAVCIFQLIDKGDLQIDDKIDTYLAADLIEKIPNGDEATIKNLLNHSSGIPDFANQPQYLEDLINFTEGGPAPKDELSYIKDLQPDFKAGKKHLYSNTGYYILQLLVAEVSRQNFENYLLDHVISKISLENTYYKNLPSIVDYQLVPNYYIDWEDDGNLSNSTQLENIATQSFEGYSGLLASIEDYYTFLKALFVEGSLISAASLEEMKSISHRKNFGYGQGLEVILSSNYPDKYGHKGGSQSSFFYYPEEETFVLSMLNYSFITGGSPFDKLVLAPDKIGKNANLIGEIERCLFD